MLSGLLRVAVAAGQAAGSIRIARGDGDAVPAGPRPLVRAGAELETAVGPDLGPGLGAAAVAGFLIGVSPIMHDFWRVQDPEKRQSEMINFTKNMALLGGSLALMGVGDAQARNCL